MSEQPWPTSNVPDRQAPDHVKSLGGFTLAAMIGVALSMIANALVLAATWRAVDAVNPVRPWGSSTRGGRPMWAV